MEAPRKSREVSLPTMRTVAYLRHEFHGPSEAREASLATFVYDVPYLGACGIFRPFHVLNEILESGGGDGGMSPGGSWQPFALKDEEYEELWTELKALDPVTLGEAARFTDFPFKRDLDLEGVRGRYRWMASACKKHRDAYHAALEARLS